MPVVVPGGPGEILREAVMGGQQDEISGRLPGGLSVGHWSDPAGMTGCTVVLAPDGAVGGVDVRGGRRGRWGPMRCTPARSSIRSMASCWPAAAPSGWPRPKA
jgi:L-aminopeptidase/D-esterase-like protein